MNKLFKLVNKAKDVCKTDTICRCLGLPLVSIAVFSKCVYFEIKLRVLTLFGNRATSTILDNAIMLTVTPGNDYVVLVFRWLTLGQPQIIQKLMVLFIRLFIFVDLF